MRGPQEESGLLVAEEGNWKKQANSSFYRREEREWENKVKMRKPLRVNSKERLRGGVRV